MQGGRLDGYLVGCARLANATAELVEGFFAPLPPMRVVDAHGRSRVVTGLELEGVYPNELLAAL